MTNGIPQLKIDLENDEGRVGYAYKDTMGHLTIGVGHLIDKRQGGSLPDHIIDALLDHDIEMAMQDLDRNTPWWRNLPEGPKRGLVNMAFNLGWPRLSRFVKMLAALKDGRWEDAKAEAIDSDWYGQVGARGARVANLLAQGEGT